MNGRLESKAAIVTGAASGFGRETALLFAREGAKVLVADLDADRGKQVVEEIVGAGGEAVLGLGDVSDLTVARSLVTQAVAEFDRLDVLVNNAGIASPSERSWSWDSEEEDWDKVIRVNLRSVYACTRAAVPELQCSGRGSVVNVASIAASVSVGGAAYAASKGGMLSYTRHVSAELGPQVRVNCVSPGYMMTPMSDGSRRGMTPEEQQERRRFYASLTPMERAGEAEDIANAVLYFASDESGFVTGQELIVDGGHTRLSRKW